MRTSRAVSRRQFIKATGAGIGALGLGPLLAACNGNGDGEGDGEGDGVTRQLDMWWWGEQELPGLQDYVTSSVAAYEEATGHTIRPTLQDTDVVISQFQTAAAAGSAPDLQYLWNGIYHMESVWLGYVEPLNGLVDTNVIEASSPTELSVYQGDTYRVGWYPIPMLWYYNKALFEQAGLDPDSPPRTWDEFLNACDRLKAADIAPVGGGIQDGYWGEWWVAHALSQCVESTGEALELFIGERDFRDPQHYEIWSRLEELVKLDFINPEMASLELYPGIDLIVQGQLGMGLSIGTRTPEDERQVGEALGVMVMPVFRETAMAGRPILDTQGLGISSQSEAKETAADFLEFLNTPDRLDAMWEATGWMPSNSEWDSSAIETSLVTQLWNEWVLGDNIPFLTQSPGQVYEQALLPNGQEVISGGRTGEEAGDVAARVVQEWREFNPDLLESFVTWSEGLI